MEGARPALSSDLQRLSELLDEAIASTPEMRGGHLYGRPLRDLPSMQRLRRCLEDRHRLLLCGTLENHVVGLALVSVDDKTAGTHTAIVEELYVEPEAREMGVGEALVSGLVRWAQEIGCSGIDMPALPGDRATKNLCERSGFSARSIWMHRSL